MTKVLSLDFSLKKDEVFQRLNADLSQLETNEILNFLSWYFTKDEPLSQFTSGSTGKPKNIKLPKKVLTESAQATINFFQIPERSNALLCIPAKYIGGKMMVVRGIIGQWKLDVIAPKIQLDIPEKQYEFVAMVPAQVQHLIEHDLNSLKRIKHLIIGGAPVSDELEKALCTAEINAYSTYGMTETASHVALKKLDLNSHFKALEGITFSTDEENRLIIHGARIPDSPLLTNDVVGLYNQREFKWLGRSDNVINSGGVKIQTEELEKAIAPFIITPFYVSKETHNTLGEVPVLVLEGEEWGSAAQKELLETLKNAVPKHWNPTKIRFKREFLYTESGKIKRV